MDHSRALFRLFSSFQPNITSFTTNKCEKCPSSIRCWDSNPRHSEHKSSPITTRPGLLPRLVTTLPNNNRTLNVWLLRQPWVTTSVYTLMDTTNVRIERLDDQAKIRKNTAFTWRSQGSRSHRDRCITMYRTLRTFSKYLCFWLYLYYK